MDFKHKLVFISMILITILCISSVSVVSASTLDNNLTDNTLSEHMELKESSESVNSIDKIDSINEPIEINEIDPIKESKEINEIDPIKESKEINEIDPIKEPMEINDDSVDLKKQDISSDSKILTEDNDEEEPDKPDLTPEEGSDEINYVYQSNIKKYFQNGVLKSQYENKTLVFIGDFEDLGKLTIDEPNVNITGLNARLKNIVFDIRKSDISLSNLNLELDKEFKENHGAAIFVAGDNANLYNLTINYTVPDNVEAYGILSNEYIDNFVENLKITSCSIYFEGHNEDFDVYNCAVKLIGAYCSIMENNTIICSLPLKDIDFDSGIETLDSEFAYAIGLEDCESFILNNNTIITDVNKRPATLYPTLDSISIGTSDNVIISNNSIYMTDFVTPQGVENFLYGINAYNLNDLLIINNSISMITTGGKLGLGTAYPIQIAGPTSGINITENNISSVSNGPNIGIYSQNSFGDTELFVSKNIINITGLAGQHSWALVTGVESQDTYSEIFNNTIEVHSIAEVNEGDNIYGISYRQTTSDSHSFKIENNTAFSDGTVGVYLFDSEDTYVKNNTLISFNENAKTGDNSYEEGTDLSHTNTHAEDNHVITATDYYKSQNPNIAGNGEGDDGNHHSNPIIPHKESEDSGETNPRVNPIIPGYNPGQGTGDGDNPNDDDTYSIDDGEYGEGEEQGSINDNSYNNGPNSYTNANGTNRQHTNINGDDNVNNDGINSNTNNNNGINDNENSNNNNNNNINSNNNGGTNSNTNSNNAINSSSNDLKTASNSTESNPGLNGNNPIGKSPDSSSGGHSDSSAKKAFKIEEVINFAKDKTLEMILLIIGALILLIVGYKRKNTFLE